MLASTIHSRYPIDGSGDTVSIYLYFGYYRGVVYGFHIGVNIGSMIEIGLLSLWI